MDRSGYLDEADLEKMENDKMVSGDLPCNAQNPVITEVYTRIRGSVLSAVFLYLCNIQFSHTRYSDVQGSAEKEEVSNPMSCQLDSSRRYWHAI